MQGEVVAVTIESDLTRLVRTWAYQDMPNEPEVADEAAAVARAAYRNGASPTEACARARAFLRQRRRGGSGRPPGHAGRVPHPA